jgi:PKD repeat protein
MTAAIRAVATNPLVRATALFSADAAPVWLLSTDINTAVVSCATEQAIPKAITTIAGNTPSCSIAGYRGRHQTEDVIPVASSSANVTSVTVRFDQNSFCAGTPPEWNFS